MQFASIIVDITNEQVDKPYTYKIPEHLEQVPLIGMSVKFPFGRYNKEKTGFVIDIKDKCDFPIEKVKEIIDIVPKSTAIETNLIDLAIWMSKEYGSTIIQALKTVLPVKSEVKKRGRKKINEELNNKSDINNTTTFDAILSNCDIANNYDRQIIDTAIPKLNKGQQFVYDEVTSSIRAGARKDYLLYGVTGSGKTLLYMEIMKAIVDSGKQGIVLIPEIALTPQTIHRFQTYFHSRVGFINSKLSNGERYEIFQKAKNGDLDVVIGPRSALFMPFNRLGMIIIDEEHETSYKSEKTPCYHAREVAFYRGEKENASVILGSGTPSVTSYYYATNKDCKHPLKLLQLPNRAGGAAFPQVRIVDMREELHKGNKEIISLDLDDAINGALSRGEQIMLFLNRRGYAGFVSCRECGYTIKCDHCDVSMSYHKGGKMVCHYCGAIKTKPTICPECGSKHISTFKIGTEQLEEYLINKYPSARVIRMDADTTKNKGGHDKVLEKFRTGQANILIGTQMIVKGHDFPNVTVVGAIAADMSLNSGDYMSGERTFDLLAQAAGRAGRADKPGEVFIQTYNPDNYAIEAAAKLDYKGFFREEMMYRHLMGYPPASHMLKIMLQGKDEALLDKAMDYFASQAKRFEGKYNLSTIGPAEPYAKKLKDIYRKVLYVKSSDYDILIRLKDYLEKYFELNSGFKDMYLQFNFDPMGD